ncbi:unnamed protein product [Chironomus riparius]|uniref:SH3 and multiple ankyrin repeat domains protein n=1 Tax=Chironomus riparius TaxID=315576 RepID=A0A9N9S0J3_9DIPT|nr:unnamed protein product [Chironomus riparius]
MSSQFDDDIPPAEIAREGWILVRIHVPELDIFKCLQFPVDKLIWDIKQQVLASLPKELKESFNYGLFLPPANGKAGKFLDEERRLGDYPFNGPVGYLELKYKRRVYKLLNVDERQLRALHSRSNLRRFLEYVNGGHVEKISKMCSKGLDPNFHCSDSGETPLSIATSMKKPQKLLIALVNGGAILDYRSRDGTTALHKAVERDTLESVMTLLELGASPNYRDAKMLTPAYLSVLKKTDPKITEVLLHDHATLGTQDTQGWNEVHQACRNGLVHHLEHLLVYGADMNSKNSTGNTPLHVCAVNNQEACARMLLFRGANREALNFANQTPYQVAVIASNFELAELIRNYKNDDIVPIRVPPRYNPRRRSGLGCWYTLLNQSSHNSGSEYISPTSSIVGDSWNNSHYHTFSRLIHITSPSSPCPSDRPFNSASSSLSESSSSHRSQEDDISFVTDKSLGDTSDVVSDSSGVGTNSESANCSIGHPSTTVVCIEKYEPQIAGHLSIQAGDIIEVVGSTDCGLLEGFIRGSSITGFFPSRCTQEVQFRQKNNNNGIHNNNTHLLKENIQPLVGNSLNIEHCEEITEPDASYNNTLTSQVNKNFTMSKPRTVLLHRAKRGFGFVLRGAKAASPLMQLKPSTRCPALQYLDDVDKGGVADVAGLKKGDFLLAINGEDVSCTSHEYVVELIRNSSEYVTMTVLTVDENSFSNTNLSMMNGRQCSTLPRRFSGSNKMPVPPAVPRRDPKTTLSVGRARARSMVAGLEANEDHDECGISMKASSTESLHQQTQSAISTPLQPGTPIQPRTASIKSRPTSSRITAAELEDLFQRQQGIDAKNKLHSSMMTTSRFQSNCESSLTPPYTSPSKKQPLVYASIAEMKRKKTKVGGTLRGRPVEIPSVDSDLKRTFHSSPDLALTLSGSSTWTSGMLARKGHISQEDLQNLHISMQRLTFLPPPNCKPPPPPIDNNHQPEIGQVVKVDVSRKSEYESTSLLQRQIQQKIAAKSQVVVETSSETVSVMSSFKPSSNTKIYASPQEINITNNDITNNNSITSNYSSTVTKNVIINNNKNNNNNEHYKSSSDYNVTKVIVTASSGNLNPYAQPGKIGIEPPLNLPPPVPPIPPIIPEPDYSESDEEEEANNSVKLASNVPFTNESVNTLKRNDNQNQNQHKVIIITKKDDSAIVEKENSGNSSTGSSSIVSHSYSVDEIQRIRSGLKSSKTFPNAFQNNSSHNNHMPQEGDNSSSGVSSDQEIKMNYSNNLSTTHNSNKIINNINNNQHKSELVQNKVVLPRKEAIISTEDAPSDEDSPPLTAFQRNNSLTRKQASIIAANRAKVLAQNQGQIVSLSQLPPPLEADSDEEVDNGKEATYIVAPPPPEFSDIVSNTRSLHIPTQQSQQYRQYASVNYMQQNQQKGVRIVGALPKHNNMPGQSAAGKIVRTNHPHHHIHHYHHQHHY